MPPVQPGSVGSGSDGAAAVDQRVSTSPSAIRASARRTAVSKPVRPPGGSGMCAAIPRSPTTASCTRLCTSGRASRPGTGVTSPTQYADSRGVSGRTGTMTRRDRPATFAYRRIMPANVSTSGPPTAKSPSTVSGRSAAATR
ncbi:hypothetical protein Psuf_081470 [Phytohabitans suffuscus]|uniref:Uncharacterized protein n=1 Tax=Phytohabitans suffuscus TaxID=624315 RepID=A0A6F8YXQ3_9ACTN|nr:hypothetical protein Psuf_081470 [Phytohabitans suffuscus]